MYNEKSRLVVSCIEKESGAASKWVLKSVWKLEEGNNIVHQVPVGAVKFPKIKSSHKCVDGRCCKRGLYNPEVSRSKRRSCCWITRPQNFVVFANQHCVFTRSCRHGRF